jgi:hypothetical protein
MTNLSSKDMPRSYQNKAVTAVCNRFLVSHAHSNHGLLLVHNLSCILQTLVSLHARVCIIYWMDACLYSERRFGMRSALLRICHFIHTDHLVPQCICSYLANSTCSIRNSTVQTAGKVGHVHFCCNSLQVCMGRRSSSERTWAGQCTVQTDSQNMNISTALVALTPWPHIQETAVLKARSYQNRNSILNPRTWPKQYQFCKQRYVQNSRYSPSANTYKTIFEERKLTRCYATVYWTYDSLNMFRALSCPSSGAWDYTNDHSMWHITLVIAGRWSGVWL